MAAAALGVPLWAPGQCHRASAFFRADAGWSARRCGSTSLAQARRLDYLWHRDEARSPQALSDAIDMSARSGTGLHSASPTREEAHRDFGRWICRRACRLAECLEERLEGSVSITLIPARQERRCSSLLCSPRSPAAALSPATSQHLCAVACIALSLSVHGSQESILRSAE